MRCKYCGEEYEGNFCPKCGVKASLDHSTDYSTLKPTNIAQTGGTPNRKHFVWLLWRWGCSLFAFGVGIWAIYLGHSALGIVVALCAILEIPQIQDLLPSGGKSKITWFIGTIAIFATVYAIARCSLDVDQINQIRGGTPTSFPNVTYEEAFDEYFSFPRWTYIEDSSGQEHVEFTGRCVYNGEKIKVYFLFTDNNDETFSITELTFNDIQQDQFTCWEMVDTIFESFATGSSR